ncbi:MAG: HAMP domain-containing protein [Desulfobacteraceae bacterium]|nr:HAMP domain-containing protein [Desulfobacteraceae bacterium]
MNKFSIKMKRLLKHLKGWFGKRQTTRDDLFIGEILKRNGVITENQLKMALENQRATLLQHGRAVRLGQLVVELGLATEKDVIQTINSEYQIQISSLTDDIRELLANKYGSYYERLPHLRISIWMQMALAITFIIMLTIVTLSLLVLDKQKGRLYDQSVRLGMVSLNYFANNAPIPLLEDDILQLNTLIKEAARVKGLRYALIVGANDLIKAHTDINLIGVPFKHFSDDAELIIKDDITYYSYNRPDGERLLNLYRDISFKNKSLGQVHVGISLNFIEDLIKQERVSIIIVTLAITLLGLGIALIYGFRFSRPISDLVKATREIAKGNYQYRVALKRNDELGSLGAAFNRMGQELWKNAMAQKSFGKYVGSEILDMILANPETEWLKGTHNEATIFLGDIRGFTAYASENSPEQVVEALNEFLEIAATVIIKHGGYVDKFIGDAILGVFGVPVVHKDHVERAIRASLNLQDELRLKSLHGNQLLKSVGISVHTGVVVAGNVGAQSRLEYTVIGDTVNLASRLNAMAGPGDIVISRQVKQQLSERLITEPLGSKHVKGRAEPVDVYKVLRLSNTRYAS